MRLRSEAHRRAATQAERWAVEVRTTRAQHGWTRPQVSRRAGVSTDTVRRIEGGDPHVQLDPLCAVGAAVGLDLVLKAYLSRPPSLRDAGQLELAEALRSMAHPSWDPILEMTAGENGEAIDIGFLGVREIIDAEIERLIVDFQAQYRRNARKRDFLAAQHRRPVRLVMVVEDTIRNRSAVAPHLAIITSALPAGTREIRRALVTGQPLGRDGVMWIRRSRAVSAPINRSVRATR